ncbi:tetratricopeptide repeat protein [Paraglaciecola arctica]|uniref:Tetratricopeptide TPR_2 n=1 Tax=Paraglaciecola arctica BSs20135 TaxID=493475 RepID=K6Y9C8_9ALTE|nr:tetratricopeptide repeat protein [Paraglaciecola arctica]GAC20571.1 tetratricopeptide TPR_2 [Paraglaciecola arctica BSs20135]
MQIFKFLLTSIILLGCQAAPEVLFGQKSLLFDQGFEGFENVAIESEKEIFELHDEAKTFAKLAVKGLLKPEEKIKALVQHVFARSDLNLLYRADANTVASQTFQNRAANCLSMSIMTFALAKELGFDVRFQDIEIPEYWTIREGQSLLNRHINLQIIPRQKNQIYFHFITRGFEVDFDAQATRQHFPKTLLKLKQVVAMFHNNNGADALLKRNYVKAYAYFRAAILQSPDLSSALANLGYLYRLTGHYTFSENAYLQAIKKSKNNLSAWGNLAHLYRYLGDDQKAMDIVNRVSRKRSSNPFFHINMGDKAFEKEQWQVALEHYQRALKLDKSYHEVYFGLGKTYFELGNVQRSHHYLKLAKKKSRTEQEQAVYQGKIDMLASIKSG